MIEENPATHQKSNDWSHFIVENTPAGIITLDGQEFVTYCNPPAEKIIGITKDQIIGRQVH